MAFRIPVYTRAEVENGQKQWLMFLSGQLILQFNKGSNGLIPEKISFSKDPEGVQHFPRGPIFFQGGPNANFYRYPYNL